MECVLRDLVTENADLQSRNQTKDRELAEAQQQLREKVSLINSGIGNPLFSLTCRRNRWLMMLRSIPDCSTN